MWPLEIQDGHHCREFWFDIYQCRIIWETTGFIKLKFYMIEHLMIIITPYGKNDFKFISLKQLDHFKGEFDWNVS